MSRCNMSFKDNREGNIASLFLSKAPTRKKSEFVALLICNYLETYGIKSIDDLNSLDERQVNNIIYKYIDSQGMVGKRDNTSDLLDIIKNLIQKDGAFVCPPKEEMEKPSLIKNKRNPKKETFIEPEPVSTFEEEVYDDLNDFSEQGEFELDSMNVMAALNAFNN